jgi:hypothetical protein
VSLRPLTNQELSEFIEGDLERYVEERVKSGERPDAARRIAREQSEALFPNGSPADGQLLFRVLDDKGMAVGTLWIGPNQLVNQGRSGSGAYALRRRIGARDTEGLQSRSLRSKPAAREVKSWD